MEKHKLHYLNDLIKRLEEEYGVSREDQLSKYLEILGAMEDHARAYYSEVIELEKNDFLEMLLLDGCFIIEYFRKRTWSHLDQEREMDPLFTADWAELSLSRDLLLIENQIPFFVLKEMHFMIGDSPANSVLLTYTAVKSLPIYAHLPNPKGLEALRVVLQSISNLGGGLLRDPVSEKSRQLDRDKVDDIKHLLDLVHRFMLIEETLVLEKETVQQSLQVERQVDLDSPKSTYSTTELRDLGVKFKCVNKDKFYDIKFENGILEIPVIRITDNTEARFRNLIAYEEHRGGKNGTYLTDYTIFMDSLIDSPKDVELLRREGIIKNLLGDDEAISTMFNMIGKNVTFSWKFYHANILHDLTEHCRKRRHVWMAKFRRNSPWTILSLVGAVLFLLLTIVQTVFSVLSYTKQK